MPETGFVHVSRRGVIADEDGTIFAPILLVGFPVPEERRRVRIEAGGLWLEKVGREREEV